MQQVDTVWLDHQFDQLNMDLLVPYLPMSYRLLTITIRTIHNRTYVLSYLLLLGIPSPTHSFIPGLKPSFSANPSHCSPSFLLLKYTLHGFSGLFTVISEHIFFYF